MKRKLLTVILFVFSIIQGCFREELDFNKSNQVQAITGAYILSEGNMTPQTSMLSFYNALTGSFTQNIFAPANLGLFPDGLIIHGPVLFILEQGNYNSIGKIYKTDTNGIVINFALAGTNPYSLCISNNKIYLTNGPSGSVSVLDIDNLSLIKSINVGVYPQEILSIDNKVFVCNTGLYSGPQDSTVSVIDANLDIVLDNIKVRKNPSSLAKTKNNKLVVGCPDVYGYVYLIDPIALNKLDSFELNGGFDKDIAVDYSSSSNEIYYISNSNSIAKLNLDTRTSIIVIPNSTPSITFFYGYNYDHKRKKHFVADARNFAVTGSLNIYNSIGILESVFVTGIAPRRIVFKYN